MIEVRQGKVVEILSQREGLTTVQLEIEGEQKKGIGYDDLIGEIRKGDQVLLNTTATSLELGTGGYDFIIYILNQARERAKQGHIMKLRYTPYQIQTFSVEEQDSPYHERINNFHSLSGTPVVVGTLHSMLAPITVMAKASSPKVKITYIMTDAAALPLRFSNTVDFLKGKGIIDSTVTIGHAFGGDLEAVNIYSGLISAYEISEADIIVVCMGPGIVGTGTKYGFTGIEQANILNAVYQLGGSPIAVPRIGFGDKRERHYGLSHHSRTTLGELTMVESKVGIPYLDRKKAGVIKEQLVEAGINHKHQIIYREGDRVLKELKSLEFTFKTMGRGLAEEKEYFMTAGIAGIIASEELRKDG